ncbi:MAG: hypothetical protein OIF38_11365, partial [Cellvibrionaceae bacterium]|nr:hypothetical protein [Cellvibrionaceae bacterium]
MPEPGTKTVVDKRKPAKSLAQQLRQQLTWLGLLLLLAFNAVIFGFILYTIDSSTDIVLELEARAIADQLRREPHKPLPRYKSLSAYQKWLDIPATLRLKISPSGQVIREPRLIKDQSANDEPMYIHYLPHHSDDVGDIYIISQHPLADVQNTIGAVISRVLSQAFWLATSIVWVLFICVAWLFRQTSAPLSLLSQWAEQLGKSPQQAREINFPIAELNQLAAQLRHGVEQEHAYNLREQMFLKQASHELRTPLATIRASLDTLALDQTASSKPIIQRAINSSEKIELLSKALLWLCSDTDQPLAKHRFNPAQMCRELYGQLQPLFQRNSH